MLERGVLTMNAAARTARQHSPTPATSSEDIGESSDLLSNPSYDIITGDVDQFTPQYYHTVEPSEGLLSPKDGGGSSSDSSTSGRSKTSSTSSDEGSQGHRKRDASSPLMEGIRGQQTSGTGLPSLDYSVPALQQKVAVTMCNSSESMQGVGAGDGSSVKHWSYEEQFKQLYNLSDEPERKEFLDRLFDYMQKKGSPITRVPIMAKQPLDLYRLFKLVVERGGLVEVIKKKAWRAVAKELNLPASITSAAFTMRSQYVKYLYPYECEIENLSDPQELQVAIDSHKRDRRQSDTVDFMHQSLPSARAATLDSLTPVTSHVTAAAATPQGLQILSSPTVALPHGAIPPYSGSFIVTGPGGAQMVTPQISGPPQLVQMTTPHGIPIMVPALTPGKTVAEQLAGGRGGTAVGAGGGEGDDRDDVSSQASSEASDRESSAPPLKRVAVDIGGRVVPTTRIPSVATATPGFMMAPAGRLVPTSHFASPHVVQVGPSPHIPIVMPTTTATGFVSQTSSPMETGIGNGMVVKDDGSRRSPLENGGCSPHLVSTATGKRTVISASNLLPQSHSSHPLPLILPSTIAVGHHGNSKHRSSEPSSLHSDRSHVDHTHSSMAMEKPHSKHNGGVGVVSTAIPIKPSIANIAIQSANKDGEGSDSTLLVTLEINDTVFQGVLFAKPTPSASPSR